MGRTYTAKFDNSRQLQRTSGHLQEFSAERLCHFCGRSIASPGHRTSAEQVDPEEAKRQGFSGLVRIRVRCTNDTAPVIPFPPVER